MPDNFPSLTAMKAAHVELLRSYGTARDLDADRANAVLAFIRAGVATGAVLDTPDDRAQAQGLLDYWTTVIVSAARKLPTDSTDPGAKNDVAAAVAALKFNDTLLKDYDAGTIRTIITAADSWYTSLPPGDRALTRLILLRLATLPHEGITFTLEAVPRALFDRLGPPEEVNRLIAALQEKGVIRVASDDRLVLSHEALTREWGVLADILRKRLEFRNAVQYWLANGEARSALVRDELLDAALDFHDLNGTERDFVTKSHNRERFQNRIFQVASGVLALLVLLAGTGWIMARSATKKAEDETSKAEKAATEALAAEAKARKAEGEATAAGAEARKAEGEATAAGAEALKQKGLADDAAREAKQRRDALVERQELSLMMGVTRVVAEIREAVTPADRQILFAWFDALTTDPKPDSDIAKFLQKNKLTLERVRKNGGTPDDRQRLSIAALDLAREVRSHVRKSTQPEVLEFLQTERDGVFSLVDFTATEIVKSYHNGSFRDASPFIREFWILYWGEMGLAEGDKVARAMVDFGDVLKTIDEQFLDRAPEDWKAAYKTAWASGLTTHQTLQLSLNGNHTFTSKSPPAFLMMKVDPATRTRLDSELKQLKAAMAAERSEPLK